MPKDKEPTKTQTLYGGRVIIDFYGEGKRHDYKVKVKKNGAWIEKKPMSVTGATGVVDKSGPLMWWAANLERDFLLSALKEGTKITEQLIIEASKQHQKRKEEAATIGDQVHEWVENYIKGLKPSMPDDPKVLNGVTAFLQFIDQHDIKFISTEKLIYSLEHDYVGLCDSEFTAGVNLQGEKENHKIVHVGDWKTGNGIYSEAKFQTAGYQGALAEESDQDYGSRWILRFGKEDAEFHPVEVIDQKADFKAFLNCLNLKRRLNELKEEEKKNGN